METGHPLATDLSSHRSLTYLIAADPCSYCDSPRCIFMRGAWIAAEVICAGSRRLAALTDLARACR
jgi:hypothetical protein